jgi:hypothetical protein
MPESGEDCGAALGKMLLGQDRLEGTTARTVNFSPLFSFVLPSIIA